MLPEGSAVVARVLDVSKADGVVDLSLKPHLLPPPRKSGKPAKPTTQPKADKWKVHTRATSSGAHQLAASMIARRK